MLTKPSLDNERVRVAELVAALCLATDLGMGFPLEHGLQTTLIASRLADALDADQETQSRTYYASMLSHAGCTTDAHVSAEVFGGSLRRNFNPVMYGSAREVVTGLLRALPDPERSAPVRAIQTARRLPRMAREQRPHLAAMCEVAQMLAEGVGLPPAIGGLLAHLTERWDGRGPLRRAKGDEIPLPMRIVHVAVDATFQRLIGGCEHAARIVRERAGGAFDPQIAGCLSDEADEILALDQASVWEETLAREPGGPLMLEGGEIDRALEAMAGFADLISPYFSGHSTGVAELSAAAAARCRIDPDDARVLRRAALVHDLGRVAVHPRIWQKPGPLSADEWEQARLHPYQTERVLSRSPFLSALAPVAAAHHERLDGSGYHRQASGAQLILAARLLAAADAFHAMIEPRPHREPLPRERAAEELGREASAGRLDADVVTVVIEGVGERAPRLDRPAGLTEREAEVIGMLARGLMTKQVARALGVSAKTADTHIQNAYRKLDVSTRAAATLFAIEHGLVVWADLPHAAERQGRRRRPDRENSRWRGE